MRKYSRRFAKENCWDVTQCRVTPQRIMAKDNNTTRDEIRTPQHAESTTQVVFSTCARLRPWTFATSLLNLW